MRTLPRERKGELGDGPLRPRGRNTRQDRRGGLGPVLTDSGRGRWGRRGRPGTGPLDGSGPAPARLSAADGGLGAALRPGAHVRAWLSPSSLRAPAGIVPSPQTPACSPPRPQAPRSSHTAQPNRRLPPGLCHWLRTPREAGLSPLPPPYFRKTPPIGSSAVIGGAGLGSALSGQSGSHSERFCSHGVRLL